MVTGQYSWLHANTFHNELDKCGPGVVDVSRLGRGALVAVCPVAGLGGAAVHWRRCETCNFHEPGPTACTGRCVNPNWQPANGVPRLVRDRETACYGGWGIDHWQPKRGGPGSTNGTQGPMPGGGGGTPYRFPTMTGASPLPIIPLRLLPRGSAANETDELRLSD